MSLWMTLTLSMTGLLSCATESIDWTGEWRGTASWIVDGEPREVPLRLELSQNGADIGGTILWGDYRRAVTSASARGPEVEIESSMTTDRVRFKGLFRNDALEGRFFIQYAGDPEPFPGSFTVERER